MKSRVSRIALCIALALGSVPVLAQNTTSAIAGRVTSLDNRPVVGATVVITHVESGTSSNLLTDAEGRYHARGLRAGGPYTVTITKDGVVEKQENVFLLLADTTTVDARFPRPPREVITVSAAGLSSTDKFNPTNMGANTQLGRQEVESLPSIQRNLQDLGAYRPARLPVRQGARGDDGDGPELALQQDHHRQHEHQRHVRAGTEHDGDAEAARVHRCHPVGAGERVELRRHADRLCGRQHQRRHQVGHQRHSRKRHLGQAR
jgi:hypothetical protein